TEKEISKRLQKLQSFSSPLLSKEKNNFANQGKAHRDINIDREQRRKRFQKIMAVPFKTTESATPQNKDDKTLYEKLYPKGKKDFDLNKSLYCDKAKQRIQIFSRISRRYCMSGFQRLL
ncbi:MAG: hypothetical protein OEW87_15320, partial [Flavobacteriaceae bacterium]|nr:hypothetical protein [Flavobacteriaceae bacterium]